MVSPTASIAYGQYLSEVRCGEERYFYVQAKDAAGNNMNTNTDSFEVSFEGPQGNNIVVNSKPVNSD